MTRWLIFVVAVLSITGSLFAQTPTTTDEQKATEKREKQDLLADQILSDAAGLALGENRAFAYARVGSLTWKSDPKAASQLFQKAVSELVNAQAMAEAESKSKSGQSQNEVRISQTIRPAILTTIAACDAEYALESLYRTRTAAIQRALAQSGVPTEKISEFGGLGAMFARSELNLEQKLIGLAAEQNPELAIKMLQESIKKGVSGETLSLLRKLFAKDPESANSLASETLDRLLSSSFSNDPADADNVSLTTAILMDFIRDKKPGAKVLKFDDSQIRSLASKLINFTLTQDSRFGPQRYASAIPIAEKLSPGSVALLKKLQKGSAPAGARRAFDPDVGRILDGKMTPAQMLTEAKRLAPDARPTIYQNAANRMAQGGDLNGATELLNSNFAGVALENAVNSMNASYANYLIGQGKFAEAERFIDEFPESTRMTALLGLAAKAFSKDPVENKVYAVTVLNKVRGLLPDHPANATDLGRFMQLTAAFARIEPDEAFNCFEPLIPQLNELADANAVVRSFQNDFGVRSGEFILATGGPYGFQLDQSVFRTLAKADFDHTQKIIDAFNRRELRIALRLQLAESGLN